MVAMVGRQCREAYTRNSYHFIGWMSSRTCMAAAQQGRDSLLDASQDVGGGRSLGMPQHFISMVEDDRVCVRASDINT